MSVIIRLQNLPWSANALDIRGFFRGLSIPDGGVHIIGGEMGDAFIAFSTDEDARQAMMNDRGKINEVQIRLLLSSRAEMQKVIETARQQSLKMQMQMSGAGAAAASATNAAIAVASPIGLSKPAAATGGVTAGMPTPQPPVITTNSLQNILSNQLASVAAAAAAAVGHNSKPPSFLAYQQQAGIVVAPQKPVLPAPTTALASAASTQDANTSRDRHRSNSHDRDPRRSYSQDGNGGASSRRRRDRSRSRSRERDRDSRNKVYRSNRRSRSRDRSRERSRESSRDRSRDRNRNSTTNGKENKSKESAGLQSAKLKEATAAGDDLKKMQSNLMAWNMANAYQANFGTQEAMAKASVTDLAAASASTRTLLNQYGSTSSILPSIPILPNAYTTNVVNNMTTAADKITPLAANTPSMQNYTTASTTTNLTSPYNLFSNISGVGGGGDLTKSMFTLQNPYTQQAAAAPSKMATDSKVNANAIKLNPPIAAASTTAASLFGATTKSADLKDSSTTAAAATSATSATNDFSAAAASVNLAMGANPYASVYPGLFSAMNAAGAYGVTKQQQQQQSQQQQQQSPQRSSGNFSQDFMNNRNSSGNNNNNNSSSQGSNNNNSGGNNNNSSNSANNEKSFRNYDDQETGNSCIKVSNMCSSTCYSDIRKFFSGLYIPHNGIKMINDKHGLRVGVAYIRFVRPSNVQKALVRNGTMLKSKRVTLEPAPDEEFDKHEDSYHPGKGSRQSRFNQISPNRSVSPVSPSADGSGSSKFDSFASNSFKMRTYGGGQQNENRDERCSSSGAASGGNAPAPISRAASGRKESTDSKMKTTTSPSTAAEPFSVLYIEDIPNFAAEQDIMKMFSSYSIYDILLKQSPGNRRELIAFVKFHRTDDAKAAFDDKSKHLIGNRQVRVNISSEMDFNRVRAKNSRADDDGNGDGNDDDDDNNDEDEREGDNNGDRDDEDDDVDDDDDDDDADNDNNEGSSRNKKRLKRDRGSIGSNADEKTENRGNAMNTLSRYDDNRTMQQQQQQQQQNRNQNYDNDRNGGGMGLPSLFDSLPDNNFGGNLEKLKNNDPRLRRGKRPSRFDAPRTDNNNLGGGGGGGGGNTNLFGLNNASGNNNNNNCFGRQQQQQQQLQQHHHHQQQQQQHRPNHQQQNHDKELCFVLVKNCEFKTTIQDIGEYFLTKNLNAQHIEMLYNKRQQPCGDFIVEFTNQKDAQYAVIGFNNVRFNSRMMKVIRITPQEIADRLNMPFMNYFPRNRVNNNNGGGGGGGGGNNNNSMNRNDFNDGRFMDCGGNGNFGNFNNNNGNNFNNFRGNHDNFQAPNMGRIGGGVGSSNNFNNRRNNMNNFRRDNNNDDFDDDDDDDCVGGGGGGIGADNDFIDNKISIDDIRNDGGIGPGGGAGSIGGGGSMNDFGSPQSDNKNCNNDDNNGIPDKFNRSGCVLEMENVPYRAELMDIMNFFQGFNIKPDDIIRRFNDDGTATGDARVAFETEAEARAAYEAKRQKSIFNRTIYLNLL